MKKLCALILLLTAPMSYAAEDFDEFLRSELEREVPAGSWATSLKDQMWVSAHAPALLLDETRIGAAAGARALETGSREKSSLAFSKERSTELHKLRGKIITAKHLYPDQLDLALALHDLWSHNKIKFEEINRLQSRSAQHNGDVESFKAVLTSLASVDQTIFNALKKFETDIDSKKEEEKKS